MGKESSAVCPPDELTLSWIKQSIITLDGDPDSRPTPKFRRRCLAAVLKEQKPESRRITFSRITRGRPVALHLSARLAGVAAAVMLLICVAVPALAGPEAVARRISSAAQTVLEVLVGTTPTPVSPAPQLVTTVPTEKPTTMPTAAATTSPESQGPSESTPLPVWTEPPRPLSIPEVAAGELLRASGLAAQSPSPMPEPTPKIASQPDFPATIPPTPLASPTEPVQLDDDNDDSQDEAPAPTTPPAITDDQDEDQESEATPEPVEAPSATPEDNDNQDSEIPAASQQTHTASPDGDDNERS